MAACLRAEEKALWDWFSSAKFLAEHADRVRLEILKTTYRLERDRHAELYALADEARTRLWIEAPVTLYQAQVAAGMNAALFYLPGDAHVVFAGPLLTTLAPAEIRAVLAHELAHFALWQGIEGEMLAWRGDRSRPCAPPLGLAAELVEEKGPEVLVAVTNAPAASRRTPTTRR